MRDHTPMKRLNIRVLAGLALLGLALPTTAGCNRHMLNALVNVATLAVAVGELASAANAMSHAHHVHGEACGHQWARVDGRDVYFADGYWEFYDTRSGVWYVYPEGLPEY